MLLPFSRRHLAISASHPAFLGVLVRDMVELDPDFQGYVQLVTDEEAHYLLVAGGHPTQQAHFRKADGRLQSDRREPWAAVEGMGSEAALLVMATDQMLTSLLAVLMSRAPDSVLPAGMVEADRIIEQLTGQSDLFLIATVRDCLVEPAIFVQGELQGHYRFDRATHAFVIERDGDAYLEHLMGLEGDAQVWVYADPLPGAVLPPGHLSRDDPFHRTMDRYVALFDFIRQEILDSEGDASAAIQQVLGSFKKKYPPLFRGVYVNPETRGVNWHFFGENRLRLSPRYRYDLFFLYMDELLLALIKKLYEIKKVRGIMRLIEHVADVRKAAGEHPDYFQRVLFAKLDSLLKSR